MYNEKCFNHPKDSESLGVKLISSDPHDIHMTGEIIDRIYKNGELVEERVGHNTVVNSFVKIVMALLRTGTTNTLGGYAGIQYWAVGSGASSWDSNMPNPDVNAYKLTTEIGRVPISPSEISYLNEDYTSSSTPTNILQITHTFAEGDCNGVWREFGLFGGNATSAVNSGIMINKRHHAVLTKTPEMTVERVMRFTLNLV